jgi:hypothetical protein
MNEEQNEASEEGSRRRGDVKESKLKRVMSSPSGARQVCARSYLIITTINQLTDIHDIFTVLGSIWHGLIDRKPEIKQIWYRYDARYG